MATAGNLSASLVENAAKLNDERLASLLERQVRDEESRWYGGFPNRFGLHEPGPAGGFVKRATAAFLHPGSRYYGDALLLERIGLAMAFLERGQTPDGNVSLLITNFNSPPDTAFQVRNLATAAALAQAAEEDRIFSLLDPFLRDAAEGLVTGGVHTPNHRWVVCAALAQLYGIYGDPAFVDRIDTWLAEEIDIDPHGQYVERSTTVYNAVTNNALTMVALKLDRPELLEPVRQNLDAMAYLLHANGEVVTEISRRQDLGARGDLRRYWFALRTLALRDGNGRYAAMLAPHEPERLDLALLMEFPGLAGELPAPEALPEDFERSYDAYDLTLIRRGDVSIGFFHTGKSGWITLRKGEAVIPAVRFASAFFGKGQFVPTHFERREDGFVFSQTLHGPYYQPLGYPNDPERWHEIRAERREQTEVATLHYEGILKERENGIEVTIRATGTEPVPLAIEVVLREGGELTGVDAVEGAEDAYLLAEGFAEYRMGDDVIRFGPGRAENSYVRVRGAEAKPDAPCVYLTGYTPFEQTLVFEWE